MRAERAGKQGGLKPQRSRDRDDVRTERLREVGRPALDLWVQVALEDGADEVGVADDDNRLVRREVDLREEGSGEVM